MKMNNEKSYAVLPNVAFGFNTDYQLNNDETLMFIHLQFMKQYGLVDTVRTTLDMLIEDVDWVTKTPSRDRNRVIKALENLRSKGYISLSFKEKISKGTLTVTINKSIEKQVATSTVDWKSNPFEFKGFTKIMCEEYNLAENNGYYLIAIAYTKWRENATYKWKICNKEWEAVLGVTDKTARKILDNCHPFITKFTGQKYKDEQGHIKQEANTYKIQCCNSVKPDLEVIDKEVKSLSFLDNMKRKVSDSKVIESKGIFNQIFDKNTKIEFGGYKIWKETKCEIVKKAGQTKIDKMNASTRHDGYAGRVVKELDEQYQEYIKNQNAQMDRIRLMAQKHVEELEGIGEYSEFTTSYKRKDREEKDITAFLDE
ncbi:hypothetical protein COM81_27800 [Priestia megaterium]|uniref:hypothetical protein n=1 Tax=Priestia megaterium TaxID=1404 RepID=UPI000BEE3D6F|nr:hypothetical protein [Priestia megaterium]PEE73596.1 hypothetical protein COM81_27800 [Priestia megaterium]